MKLLVVNGPNINMLGTREPEIYGSSTYDDLKTLIHNYAKDNDHEIIIYQSNHEGDLIDFIQEHYLSHDGLILNAAGYTHTSIALFDTLSAINIPTVEVHISDVDHREAFRSVNYIRTACIGHVSNEGIHGYISAIKILERSI